ncbi:MAG: DUF92 domain-containing protein [Chloroflexaceae bacterium]|nr:DUF92 domain-containing protein [Chloroflexaceae bacterium]
MIDPLRLLLGWILSLGVGGVAWWRGSLTVSGAVGAVIVGTLTFGFGGWPWGLTLVTFFVSSSLLSHYKERLKEERAGEKFAKGGRRDLTQAMANGGLGALLSLLSALLGEPPLVLACFVGTMAAATADTWATELGVLSTSPPRLVTTWRTVEPGTSGGITLVGTLASAAGGLTIGLAMFSFLPLVQALIPAAPPPPPSLLVSPSPWLLWLLPAGLLGGVAGSLADSLLGATVQAMYRTPDGKETERAVGKDGTPNSLVRGAPWLTNDVVNFLGSVAGGVVGGGVFLLMA